MLFKKRSILTGLLSFIIIATVAIPTYADSPDLDIFAESAILIDVKTGQVLYSKNEHKRMYPASITKLLTALVAIETNNPTDIISLSEEAVYSIEPGSSSIGLDVGEEVNLDQGLHALLLASANEVANGIAELCGGSISNFSKKMTSRAKELGATNSNFLNPHGLHDPNHYTSAYDMALITSAVIKEPYFQEIMSDLTYEIPPTNKTDEIRYLSQRHGLMNEQRDSRMYREEVTAGKTGFTSKAGNTLVTVAKKGNLEVVCVVLKSNRANLYKDTNAILDYGFNNYKIVTLHDSNSVLSKLPMYNIKSGQLIHVADCDVTVNSDTDILVPTSLKKRNIDTEFSLPDNVTPTLQTDEVVGSVTYKYEGANIGENELVVKNINHIPSEKPAIYPQKPEYLAPKSSDSYNLMFLISLIALAFSILFIIVIKRIKKVKLSKLEKNSLRFSKTIK